MVKPSVQLDLYGRFQNGRMSFQSVIQNNLQGEFDFSEDPIGGLSIEVDGQAVRLEDTFHFIALHFLYQTISKISQGERDHYALRLSPGHLSVEVKQDQVRITDDNDDWIELDRNLLIRELLKLRQLYESVFKQIPHGSEES